MSKKVKTWKSRNLTFFKGVKKKWYFGTSFLKSHVIRNVKTRVFLDFFGFFWKKSPDNFLSKIAVFFVILWGFVFFKKVVDIYYIARWPFFLEFGPIVIFLVSKSGFWSLFHMSKKDRFFRKKRVFWGVLPGNAL